MPDACTSFAQQNTGIGSELSALVKKSVGFKFLASFQCRGRKKEAGIIMIFGGRKKSDSKWENAREILPEFTSYITTNFSYPTIVNSLY